MASKDRPIGPLPGMQTKALLSPARVLIMGGRAGPGKSYALILVAVNLFLANKISTDAIIFRRKKKDIYQRGGLLRKAREVYLPTGARFRESPSTDFVWDLGDGKELTQTFAAIPKVDDVEEFQGPEFGFVGWDELTHFEEYQFTYLLSRQRAPKGLTPFVRATCNPQEAGWVRDLVDWWIGADGKPIPERDGVIRYMIRAPEDYETAFVVDTKEALLERFPHLDEEEPVSITFLQGAKEENPFVDWKAYNAMLALLPEWKRKQLDDGNWNAGPRDPAKIWNLPSEAIFHDSDADFQAVLRSGIPLDLYGGWDYGRRQKALCWVCGVLQPGSPPTLWIIGVKLWTDTSARTAAAERAAFLEDLDLEFEVGRVLDAGDPSGWAKDSGEGWSRTLVSEGVPLVDIQHMITPDGASATYWNSAEGFTQRTDLVQAWLEQGRLRIRQHPTTQPMITAIRYWRLDVPEGVDPITVNRAQIGPRKDGPSHPGDALTYLCAFVHSVIRGRSASKAKRPANKSKLIRAAKMARTRQLGIP